MSSTSFANKYSKSDRYSNTNGKTTLQMSGEDRKLHSKRVREKRKAPVVLSTPDFYYFGFYKSDAPRALGLSPVKFYCVPGGHRQERLAL
jgi:hypothetical protein